jgi:monoamine oxidase
LGFLQQFAALDSNFQYQGSSRSGFLGQEVSGSRNRDTNATAIPRADLFQSEFWQFKLDFFKGIDQQATMLQPRGGMDAIPKAFESRVSDRIIYNAEVTQIRKTTAGVQVSYIDQTSTETLITSDYCVCTIPATVLRNIPNDFSAGHQNEIQNFSYSQAGKLAFQSERFWEIDHNIFGGISWTDQDITQLWYPSNNFMGEQGIILGAYTFGSAQGARFATLTPTERISSGMQQGDSVHPQYSANVSNGISISWPNIPYQLGGWGVSQPNILLTEDENIFFAGEHLSILQGWQEGAILSAYSAIDLIVEKDIG